MHLFPPNVEIGDTEGFSPAKDIFGRATMGKGLTNLVGSVSDPLVIAVDGQWGSGKTTFLKMWAGELRKEGFPVIYFDAFAHDYVDDAFSAIAGEIIGIVKEHEKLKTPGGKRFVEGAIKVSKVIARAGIKIGAKAATLGALDGSEFASVATDVGDAVAGVTDDYLGRVLAGRKEEGDAIKAFRNALSDLPALLGDSKPNEPASAKPLVFIIDELDRCRPPFALAILERMKHFFSVPNIHFILGIHGKQIHSSISVTYGSSIDANLYLQKFIQIYVFLRDKIEGNAENASSKFVSYLADVMGFDQRNDDIEFTLDVLKHFVSHADINLRAVERIMTTLAISFSFSAKGDIRPADALAGLAVLKICYPTLYLKARRGTLELEDISEVFGFNDLEWRETPHGKWTKKLWGYLLDGHYVEEVQGAMGRSFSNPKAIAPYLINDVIERFQLR